MLCFYHSADLDGHCSGAIVKHRFPECEMHGINYGDPFPWELLEKCDQAARVYMVDFALQPFGDMARLASACELTWIDHHKSAIIEWEEHNRPVPYAVLDNTKAACELTWCELFPNQNMPEAVYLLGRYDIWKHQEVQGALEFQYGMRTFADTWPDSLGMEIWENLFSGQWTDKIINDGVTILQYERNQNTKFARAFAFECELDGLKCIAVNKGFTNSLIFTSVYDPSKHDAMLSFCWRGGKWTVSLYSDKPEIDCSIICKARGGGGHKGAAGYQCQELDFLPGGKL